MVRHSNHIVPCLGELGKFRRVWLVCVNEKRAVSYEEALRGWPAAFAAGEVYRGSAVNKSPNSAPLSAAGMSIDSYVLNHKQKYFNNA